MSKKISELTAASSLTGTELVEIVQSSTSKRTTAQAIANLASGGSSGTYTPTLTNVSNITASGNYVCQWLRAGNVVTVSGRLDVTPTTSGAGFQLRFTLPIASNLANMQEAAGTAAGTSANALAAIYGDATNNAAIMDGIAPSSGSNIGYLFNFSYLII